jgi:hypothetical protein
MPTIRIKYGVVHYDYPPLEPDQPKTVSIPIQDRSRAEIVPVQSPKQERESLFMALLTAFFTWLWFSDR